MRIFEELALGPVPASVRRFRPDVNRQDARGRATRPAPRPTPCGRCGARRQSQPL